MIQLALAFALAFPVLARAANGASVSVAAASDLVFCLDALHAEFTRSEPDVTLKTSIGSSGNFYAQIRHGAPYVVFLSADLRYLRELIAAGAADASSLFLYAIGRIVLWTARPELDLSDLGKLVRDVCVQRFAIANPAHALYCRAAQEALGRAGTWDDVRPKLVLGENIAQTAQFVQSGNAEIGIVAPKLAGVGRWVESPLPTAHRSSKAWC